jgi:hypothetical protein
VSWSCGGRNKDLALHVSICAWKVELCLGLSLRTSYEEMLLEAVVLLKHQEIQTLQRYDDLSQAPVDSPLG